MPLPTWLPATPGQRPDRPGVLRAGWRAWLVGLVLLAQATVALSCAGEPGPPQTINLARAEARDPRWLRDQISSMLPCRDTKSQLGCMCRPIVDVDLLLPATALERGKGPRAARIAAENRRRLQSVRRALLAVGDVGAVQMRLEYRINSAGKIVLTRPAELREARRVLRVIAPRKAGQSVATVAPPKGRKNTAARHYVVRVTFV